MPGKGGGYKDISALYLLKPDYEDKMGCNLEKVAEMAGMQLITAKLPSYLTI